VSRIEFASPLPLSECISRLENLSDFPTPYYSSSSIIVDIFPHDEDTRFYRMRKGWGWSLIAEIHGAFVNRQHTWTIATAETNIPARWYVMFAFFLFGGLSILLTMINSGNFDGLPFWIIWVIFIAIGWFSIIGWHNELLDLVKDTLHGTTEDSE
jgi:hypothetical protein